VQLSGNPPPATQIFGDEAPLKSQTNSPSLLPFCINDDTTCAVWNEETDHRQNSAVQHACDVDTTADTEWKCEQPQALCSSSCEDVETKRMSLAAKHRLETRVLEQKHQEERARLEAVAAALRAECLSVRAQLAEQQLQVRHAVK
jgi:hypothetical protein